jgi:Ca2+-binding EF-hand superfamily protein
MAANYTVNNLKNVYNFSAEQLVEFKMQFDSYDEDKSGTVEPHELVSVLSKCGINMDIMQVNDLVREFDEDGSNNLDFQEFVSLMNKMSSGPSEKDVRKTMFELFDDNLDGFINQAELLAFFKKANAESGGAIEIPREDILKQLIAEADTDGDGQLNEEEFYAVVEACQA